MYIIGISLNLYLNVSTQILYNCTLESIVLEMTSLMYTISRCCPVKDRYTNTKVNTSVNY